MSMPELPWLEAVTAIALGIGLASAVGFRIFVPLLITSGAALTGHLPLSSGLEWLGTWPAFGTLAVAALAEVLAYAFPGVDNVLDLAATPLALVAGTVAAAAVMVDLPPHVRWTVAIVAGGGAAGLSQGTTSVLRAKSTVFTAGLANPALALLELLASVMLGLIALLVPLAAVVLALLLGYFAYRLGRRVLFGRLRGERPA